MSSARRVAPVRVRRIGSAGTVSEELTHACAGFGVLPAPAPLAGPRVIRPRAGAMDAVLAASVTLIVGPSGAGKSSLMRGVRAALATTRVRAVPETLTRDQSQRACFDLLAGSIDERARALSMAGLGEPVLWARPAGVLSVGERARLRLAMGMHAATPGSVVLCDELGSSIDALTCASLCATMKRWARARSVTLVCAGAREDLEPVLAPDVVIEAPGGHARPAREPTAPEIRIETGRPGDYRALAHLHYRGAAPATMVRVLRAVREVPRVVHPSGSVLAGVLCVSMPALNSAWRHRAWGAWFENGSKRGKAERINRTLRSISRVIVEPRSRGLGIATGLVRAYLSDPLTAATEAIAAMGSVCPFFEHAGMTPYTLWADRVDTRLLDALDHLGIRPAGLPSASIEPGSLLMRELVTWGKQRKLLASGTVPVDEVRRLTPLAVCRLCSRPRAYAITRRGMTRDRPEQDGTTRPAADARA